jgi:hypothetical protein
LLESVPISLSLFITTNLIRCDKTPQKIGEPVGDVFVQDIAIVVAKAIAHPNQSLSSKFLGLISPWAVHLPDPRTKRHLLSSALMLEKAPSQCSFLMQLHKLLALDDTDVALFVRRTQFNFARETDLRSGTMSTLRHSVFKS